MLPFVRAPGIIPAGLEGPLFDPESGNEWVVVRAFVPGQTVRFPVAPLECPDPSSGLSLLQGTPAEDVDEVRNPFPAVAQGLRRSFPGILRAGAKRLCPAIRPFVQDFPLCGKHAGRPIISCTAAGNKRKFGTR
ncbi:hypothetical protein Y981_08820 [Leptospirillum ferriphilum YSK]|uniref:Uncharacterized protein n=1 Tax=Leptospirillum ferriphilum YSK TaxID=1441628 RepID=A0A059Y2Q4_9BACT|nr:hypothetical protein Y981_08820 [Leptospirillum ferriphilum YSK]